MSEQLMNRDASRVGEYRESSSLSVIKAKMFCAMQSPRNPELAIQGVLRECARPELASIAQYEYPKGDSVVRGPSIRLVEVLAQNWRHLSSGVDEIDLGDGSSVVKAYAWDMETNVSDEKTFIVKHERSTRRGSYKLTDERDIYETVANKAARRKRACILAVLPGWYVDAAVNACAETLKKSLTAGRNMEEVRRSAVSAFAEFGVTPEQIVSKIGREVDYLSENDVVKLRRLYSSIKDGFVKAEDVFAPASQTDHSLPSDQEATALDELNDQLRIGGRPDGAE